MRKNLLCTRFEHVSRNANRLNDIIPQTHYSTWIDQVRSVVFIGRDDKQKRDKLS